MYRGEIGSEEERAEKLRAAVAELETRHAKLVADAESVELATKREGANPLGLLARPLGIVIVLAALAGGMLLGNKAAVNFREVEVDCDP